LNEDYPGQDRHGTILQKCQYEEEMLIIYQEKKDDRITARKRCIEKEQASSPYLNPNYTGILYSYCMLF